MVKKQIIVLRVAMVMVQVAMTIRVKPTKMQLSKLRKLHKFLEVDQRKQDQLALLSRILVYSLQRSKRKIKKKWKKSKLNPRKVFKKVKKMENLLQELKKKVLIWKYLRNLKLLK